MILYKSISLVIYFIIILNIFFIFLLGGKCLKKFIININISFIFSDSFQLIPITGAGLIASNSGNDATTTTQGNSGALAVLPQNHHTSSNSNTSTTDVSPTTSSSLSNLVHAGLNLSHNQEAHQATSSSAAPSTTNCLDISSALKHHSAAGMLGQDQSNNPMPTSMSTQVFVSAAARAAVAKMMPGSPMISSAVMQAMQCATQVKQEIERPTSPNDEGVPMGAMLPSQKPKPKNSKYIFMYF